MRELDYVRSTPPHTGPWRSATPHHPKTHIPHRPHMIRTVPCAHIMRPQRAGGTSHGSTLKARGRGWDIPVTTVPSNHDYLRMNFTHWKKHLYEFLCLLYRMIVYILFVSQLCSCVLMNLLIGHHLNPLLTSSCHGNPQASCTAYW